MFESASHRTPITTVILALLVEYRERGLSPHRINQGACEDFAHETLDRWIGTDWVHEESTTGFQNVESGSFMLYDALQERTGWDWQLLHEKWSMTVPTGETRETLDGIAQSNPQHVWIAVDGRHYDAETPNGVESFFELPFFQRWIRSLATTKPETAGLVENIGVSGQLSEI